MSELDTKTKRRYEKMAAVHSDFLYEKVFKPAFEMAFLHGAKHMQDEMLAQESIVSTKE